MNKKKILAIIPARGGSKGLKNKNILKLKGKTIIQHTINQARNSKFISKIAVSTDSYKIQKISKKEKVWCEQLRPRKISGDKSKLYHAIKFVLNNIDYDPDIIIELHPTHVFRSVKLIDKAIEIFLKKKLKSLISILEVKDTSHPDYVIGLKNKIFKYKKSPTTFNRHFLKKKYRSSGIILISTKKKFYKNKSMIDKKCYGYIVENEIEKVDINSKIDYEFSKFLIKNENKKL